MQPFQRRSFLTRMAAASAVPFIPSMLQAGADFSWIQEYKRNHPSGSSALALVNDERFWYQVKTMYSSSPGILNLNNGGVSPQPIILQDRFE